MSKPKVVIWVLSATMLVLIALASGGARVEAFFGCNQVHLCSGSAFCSGSGSANGCTLTCNGGGQVNCLIAP